MPELPEVQAMTERLARKLVDLRITRVEVKRPREVLPDTPRSFSGLLRRARFVKVTRRAKTIRMDLDRERVLLAHMRMTGHLFVASKRTSPPRGTAVLFRLSSGESLVFRDPRGLGTMRLVARAEADALLSRLGIEPFSDAFTASELFRMTRNRRSPLKLFLMDQRWIAGLGNIYAAEALWRSRLDPRMPATKISRTDCVRLRKAIVDVLKEAVAAARAHYRRPGSIRESEDFQPAVYQRESEACLRCGWPVRRIIQGGRSTFYCPQCQR